MAMSNGVGVGAIVIGCTLLVLTFISVVCGGVAMGKMTSPAAVSIGLWGFYVSTQKISTPDGKDKDSVLLPAIPRRST